MLVEKTNEMFEEMEELFNKLMKSTGGIGNIVDMDDESLLALKKMLKLFNQSKEYAIEMAAKLDKIDSIESKLDKLLVQNKVKA